jgi:hypothetical protein
MDFWFHTKIFQNAGEEIMTFTESTIEQAAIDWIGDKGNS